MPVLDPNQFLNQAERISQATPEGRPNQVDIRRAMSTVYYGLFHHVLIALADEFVGAANRSSARYHLVYRAPDHRGIRDLCTEVSRHRASNKYTPYWPADGFGDDLRDFAAAFIDAQAKRQLADYDLQAVFTPEEVKVAVQEGRRAIERFARVSEERRRLFLTLLLCPPR